MRFDFFSRVKLSLGMKFMLVSVLAMFFVSSTTAAFFLYDKVKSVRLEMVHNGLMLLQVSVLLSRQGLVEKSKEKLKNDLVDFINFIQDRDKDVLEISVYNRNFEPLMNKIPKAHDEGSESYEETFRDRKVKFKKFFNGFFPVFIETKDSFRYYSPVFSNPGILINSPNFKTIDRNPANKEIIGFVYLERDKSLLKTKVNEIAFLLLLFFIFAFLGSAFFIFFISNKMSKPFRLLTREVKSLELGKEPEEINVMTEDELGDLSRAFNRMAKTIKARESSLEETASQLLMAFEASNEGLYDFDLSTNNVLFSPTWYELLGYEPYEFPSSIEIVHNLIHPEDREMVSEAEREYMAQKKEHLSLEFRLKTKSGEYKWIASRGKTVEFDRDDKPKRLMGAHIDITELKEAQNKIQDLSGQILLAQESERQRIARELHDNIAQNLSSLKILLQAMLLGGQSFSADTKEKVRYITSIIQECIMDVRNMSYDLCPPEIEQLGLVRAVSKFCEDFSEREKIKIEFSSIGISEALLNREININLYRIVQEALNNIKKHAGATKVKVKLLSSFPEIIFRIQDNGKGFDLKDYSKKLESEKRMGLESMKERVRLLGGKITFQTRPSEGTTILVIIPYKEKKNGP